MLTPTGRCFSMSFKIAHYFVIKQCHHSCLSGIFLLIYRLIWEKHSFSLPNPSLRENLHWPNTLFSISWNLWENQRNFKILYKTPFMCENDLFWYPIQRWTEIHYFAHELSFSSPKKIISSSFDSFGMKTTTRLKMRGAIYYCQGTHQAQAPDHRKSWHIATENIHHHFFK